MPLPEFTDDELYLINHLKSQKATAASNPYMWNYLLSGAVIAGFSAYHDNISMMVVAFVIVCGFRIYEESYTSKWLPLCSIFSKYEAAVESIDCSVKTPPDTCAPESSRDQQQ